jgi:hypothetical protein
MTKKDNPTEVRLAAIQAFRRMPCSINVSYFSCLFWIISTYQNPTILMLFLSTKQPTPILSAIEETIEAISISFSHEAFLCFLPLGNN